MKITKKQLRKIISEVAEETGHAAFVKAFDAAYKQPDGSYRGHPDDPEERRDELATQIRHASKDIYGMKDHYDLRGKSIEELEDILYDLANSPEQKYMDDEARYEMEDEMGYDSELSGLEKAPKRQGMKRRHSGSKSQRIKENKVKITRRQLRRIIREEKARLLREEKVNMGSGGKEKAGEKDSTTAYKEFVKSLYQSSMQGAPTWPLENGEKIATNQMAGLISMMKNAMEMAAAKRLTSDAQTQRIQDRAKSAANLKGSE